MANTPNDDALTLAIAQCWPHLRLVDIRDGVQSWDANRWSIDFIKHVLREENKLAVLLRKHGVRMAPIEAWGGNQVSGPAKASHEDPLVNLRELNESAPDVDLQCLYRGRQGFGLIPISEALQRKALEAAVNRGIKVVSIFDMMNDISNVKPAIDILTDLKKEGKNLTIQGYVAYISEPPAGKRAWTLDEYGDYAVDLARAGCDEIGIKNYAGVGDWEMPDLIRKIHQKLSAAGFPDMKVNLHDHGKKPEVLLQAMEAGADKVDVAFGKLSDGPSHSNVMDVLKLMLKKKGFDVDPGGEWERSFEQNPIVRQMKRIEETVAAHASGFEKRRQPPLTQEQMDAYRMAGGALSHLWGSKYIPNDRFPEFQRMWQERRSKSPLQTDEFGPLPPVPETKEEWYKEVLALSTKLWEKAGRFNTVTPGAHILCQQAVGLTNKRISGQKISMEDYTPEYLDVLIGRYGRNRGMEKGIGDTGFRDAALMHRAMKRLNRAIMEKEITVDAAGAFVRGALASPKTAPAIAMKETGVPLDNPGLRERLEHIDIKYFKRQLTTLPRALAAAMEREMTPGKSPDPTDDLQTGKDVIERWCGSNPARRNIFHNGSRVSRFNDAALLVMLLRERDQRTGNFSDLTALNLFAAIAGENLELPSGGSLPPDVPAPAAAVRYAASSKTKNPVGAHLLATGGRPVYPPGSPGGRIH